MNKKVYYEAPEAEILIVKFEENFMDSIQYDPNGTQKGNAYNPFDPTYNS